MWDIPTRPVCAKPWGVESWSTPSCACSASVPLRLADCRSRRRSGFWKRTGPERSARSHRVRKIWSSGAVGGLRTRAYLSLGASICGERSFQLQEAAVRGQVLPQSNGCIQMICRLAIGLPTLRAFECYSIEPLTKHTGRDTGKVQPGSLQECLCVYNEWEVWTKWLQLCSAECSGESGPGWGSKSVSEPWTGDCACSNGTVGTAVTEKRRHMLGRHYVLNSLANASDRMMSEVQRRRASCAHREWHWGDPKASWLLPLSWAIPYHPSHKSIQIDFDMSWNFYVIDFGNFPCDRCGVWTASSAGDVREQENIEILKQNWSGNPRYRKLAFASWACPRSAHLSQWLHLVTETGQKVCTLKVLQSCTRCWSRAGKHPHSEWELTRSVPANFHERERCDHELQWQDAGSNLRNLAASTMGIPLLPTVIYLQ